MQIWPGASPLPGHDGAGRAGGCSAPPPKKPPPRTSSLCRPASNSPQSVTNFMNSESDIVPALPLSSSAYLSAGRCAQTSMANGGTSPKRERAEVGMGLSGTGPPQQEGV